MQRREGSVTNGLALRGDPALSLRTAKRAWGPVARPPALDAVDAALIDELQRNGREPFRGIARRIGVSEATVRARYARLCRENVLQVIGVTNQLGLGFEGAMVGIRTTGPPEPVADEVARWQEADYVVVTAGQFDILVELVCEDRRHLLEVTNRIRSLAGVQSTESFVYLELRKQISDWGARVDGHGEGQA